PRARRDGERRRHPALRGRCRGRGPPPPPGGAGRGHEPRRPHAPAARLPSRARGPRAQRRDPGGGAGGGRGDERGDPAADAAGGGGSAMSGGGGGTVETSESPRRRVLIVDDELGVRESPCMAPTGAYEVTAVRSAPAAGPAPG